MMVLVVGDLHIPDRASRVPPILEKEITAGIHDMVISTGDYTTSEMLSWVQGLAPASACVHGNMDDYDVIEALPPELILEIGGKRVYVSHGSGIWPRGDPRQLVARARQRNAHVVISGHTHRPHVGKHEGIVLLNPGSITGAWSGTGTRSFESFIEIDTETWKVTVVRLRGNKIERRENHPFAE